MKNVGIICEFNPFHGGHKYLIDTVRALGAERVICLMSGNAVQRGDFAIIPRMSRAVPVVVEGADVVLELPFPYSAGSAEFFASAGVDILSRVGVDTIAFGSESGDIELLRELVLKAEEFVPSGDKNIGTAADYFSAFGDIGSNDILGIEYLKAGKRLAPDMNFITVKREGAGYHDDAEDGQYPSATELRREILEGDITKYSDEQVPGISKSVIICAQKEGEIALMNNIQSAILNFWRMADLSSVSKCAECGGGVAQRLVLAAKNSGTLEKMLEFASTKRYTASRLRRAAIFGMMGVTVDDLKRPASYVNLLAARRNSLDVLSGTRGIEIVSKPSRIPVGEDCERQEELALRFNSLYTLAMNSPTDLGYFFRQSPLIIKKQ